MRYVVTTRWLLAALTLTVAACYAPKSVPPPESAPEQYTEPVSRPKSATRPPEAGAGEQEALPGDDRPTVRFGEQASVATASADVAALSYAREVQRAVLERLTVPAALTAAEAPRLEARVRVAAIDDSGALTRWSLASSSGDPRFDAAVREAMATFDPSQGGEARLPAPEVRDLLARRGLVLVLASRVEPRDVPPPLPAEEAP